MDYKVIIAVDMGDFINEECEGIALLISEKDLETIMRIAFENNLECNIKKVN